MMMIMVGGAAVFCVVMIVVALVLIRSEKAKSKSKKTDDHENPDETSEGSKEPDKTPQPATEDKTPAVDYSYFYQIGQQYGFTVRPKEDLLAAPLAYPAINAVWPAPLSLCAQTCRDDPACRSFGARAGPVGNPRSADPKNQACYFKKETTNQPDSTRPLSSQTVLFMKK